MCVENALCKASRLEQGKAEYHGVGGYAENGTVQVCRYCHLVYKHGIDTHAYHDEKALYAQCEQAF